MRKALSTLLADCRRALPWSLGMGLIAVLLMVPAAWSQSVNIDHKDQERIADAVGIFAAAPSA